METNWARCCNRVSSRTDGGGVATKWIEGCSCCFMRGQSWMLNFMYENVWWLVVSVCVSAWNVRILRNCVCSVEYYDAHLGVTRACKGKGSPRRNNSMVRLTVPASLPLSTLAWNNNECISGVRGAGRNERITWALERTRNTIIRTHTHAQTNTFIIIYTQLYTKANMDTLIHT